MTAARKKTPRRRIGRPSKAGETLTREEVFIDALKLGFSEETAASLSGLGEATPRRWKLERPGFKSRCDQAKSVAVMDQARKILDLTNSKDEGIRLKATTWWLARRVPDFRRQQSWTPPEILDRDGDRPSAMYL